MVIFVTAEINKETIFDFTTTKSTTTRKLSSLRVSPKTTTRAPFKPKYFCGVDSIKNPIYNKYFYSKWDIYHAVIYGALPFLIILSSNILIILKLTLLKNVNFIKTTYNGSTKSLDKIDQSFKSMQITIMLLSIAFIFLIFTSPISIYMTVFYPNLSKTPEVKKEYIKVVLRYVAYINNAINFYIYICFSSEFRKEFAGLFTNCKKYKPISSAVSKCTTSTSLPSIQDEMKPLPPRTKPILRQGLKINRKENYAEDEAFLSHPDAVEQFKQNTKNAKLIYYKQDKLSKTDNGIFINSNSTYV